MSGKKASWAMVCMGIARMILHSRELRRKTASRLLMLLIFVVILGAWPLSNWLSSSVWLFLLWWGVCVFYGVLIILIALYDMMSVIKEEREKMR